MKKKSFITLFVLLSLSQIMAQTPGMIYNSATGSGSIVLDPNGDGFISATINGFTTDDQIQSEIPYKSLVFPMIEPNSDLIAGPNCSFTDFVDQGDQDPVQAYLDGNGNWLFRMRLGSTSPNSKSYSILIDTDGKFGGIGPNADPQYSNSNPGFEIEIVLATNFGVYVYDVNNNNCTPVISYAGTTNYQKSIAMTTSCGNADYFYDFFVKMSDLTTTFAPLSTTINSTTAVRMAMVDNMGAHKSTLCNPESASDIAGIDSSCGSLENCFMHIIDNYTPCAPGVVCPDRSLCPGISSVGAGDSSVSGTSVEGDGTVITVYKNGISIGTTSVSLGSWSLTGISPALITGQVITATATAPGKGQSIANCNPVTVVSCALMTTVPTAGDITKISGSKGYTVTVNRPIGTIVRCYNANGTLINPVALALEVPYNLNTVTTTTNPQAVLFKCQTGNCFGTAVYLFSYQEPGKCESGYTYDCQYSAVTSTANPTITTSPILSSTTSISGAVNSPDNVTGVTINLLANGTLLGTTTTGAGGVWTISGLSLSNRECQTLSVTAIASGKCISTGSVSATIQRKAITPVINGPICSTAAVTSVSGSSAEAVGTTVQVYENGVLEGTTTVTANGTWTAATGISIALGSTITAKALGSCLSLSNASNSVVVGTRSSNTLAITTSPIYECGSSVSGTGTNGDNVTLFVDGFQVGGTTTVSGGTWTISGLTADCSLYMGGVITAKATTGSNCEGNASAGVTVVCVNPLNSLNVTPASTSICSGSTVSVNVQGSESGVIYQLFNGASMIGSSKSGTGANITLNSSGLNSSASLTIKAIRLGTSCSINLSNAVSATIISTSVPTGNATQSFCSASTITNLTATGSTINWYAASTGGTPLATTTPLVSGTHYYASQTVSGCESASRLDVTANVTITAAPTGNATQSFCSASTIANLTATGSTINWYAASTGGTPLATTTPLVSGTHYYASQTVSGCESASRLDVIANVTITAAPTGNATQSFCSASTIANLTATGSTINWYAASTGGMPLATTTPLVSGTHYYASQTVFGCESASRLDVIANVTITAAPTGNATQSFCSASTIANLTATGSTINWYAASTGGMPLATTTPLVSGTHYYASQTVFGCESASRLDVIANVTITAAPTGNATQSFCSASTIANLTATGSTINWYAASTGGTPLATTIPLVSGTHYYASQTVSGCESASRLDVTANVTITAAPTGNATQSFCSASTIANLAATGSTINWYAASTGGTPLATTIPLVSGTHYYASQTVSGCESASRLDVTANVTITAAPTGNATQSFCSASTIANLTATGSTINWYAASTGGMPLATTTPLVSGTHYYASQTVFGCESASRLDVIANVTITAAPTGNATQSFCSASTIANLTATGSTINWYAASTGGTPLATTIPLVSGTHYYASQTVSGCESASRLDVTANVTITAAPTGNATQSFCSASTIANLAATGSTINWYAASTGGTPLATTIPLVSGTHYYASQTVSGCESASRLDVTANVTITAAPTGNATQSFCSASTIANLTATGSTINWYAASTGGTPLATTTPLVSGTHYYASQTVSGCESASRLDVIANVTITAAPTGNATQSFCSASTIANLTATGSTINWYAASTGGTPLATTIPLVSGTHYYASQTVSGCESASRLDVTANVTITAAPTGNATQSFCSASTIANLAATGSTINWYAASTGGTPLATTIPLVSGTHYYASQTVSGCESASRLDVTANVTITAAPTGNATQSFCSASTIANLTATGSTINWYAASTGGTPLATTTPLVSGTHYYASQTVSGCESASRLDVTVTVDPLSVGGAVSGGSRICSGSPSCGTDLTGHTGTIIKWQSAVSPFTIWNDISNTTATYTSGNLTQTTQFRAVVKDGSCDEATSEVTTVTVDPLSVGGAVSGGSRICSGSPSAELILTGHTGTIIKWQSAVSPFTIWNDISNTTATYTSGNLTQTTQFRAVVKDGSCDEATSEVTTVTVDPLSVGGAVSGGSRICSGSPSAELTLTGHTGTIIKWQSAVSPFTIWNDISNTTATYTSGNLTQTTQFRAVVKDGSCDEATSEVTTVTVDPLSVGGAVSGGSRICSGSPSAELTLTGHTGTIIKWQSAVSPFTIWNDISNTTATYTSGNLTQTTQFRAVVKDGSCDEATSEVTTVTVDPLSVGGAVSGGSRICSGSPSAELTLTGHTGTIIKWQSAVSPFTIWNDISNTTATYTSGNLTQTTQFRAVVKDGSCDEATSEVTTVTVDPLSVGGAVSGGSRICSGSPSAELTLTGHTGTIIKWQSAVSPFTIWNDISNTTATYTSGNLTQTTQFRAVVKDGSCDEATSEVTTVTVDPLSVGGAVSGGSRICSGSPSAELTLTGHTGTIIKWQSAVSPFTIWNDISNTTATYTSGNLTQTTQFRAVVKDGSCDEATSEVTTVTVDPLSVGGAVSGGSRICSGSPSAELTLTGHTGTIIKWQSAVSPFTIWNDISNTTATYTSGNLTQTTQFRAVVKDGSCDEATSEVTTVTVDPLSVGGAVSGGSRICSGSPSAELTLTGHTGTIIKWQSAVSPFTIWNDISNTTATYTSGNLTQTTQFRAVVKDGSCDEATSEVTTVTVDPLSVGGAVSGGSRICSGSPSAELTLTGHTGTIIKWQSAVSPFTIWNDISNTTATYTSGNLTQTTQFRAVVKDGSCDEATSEVTTVTVDPLSVGGAVSGGSRICSGSPSAELTLTGHTGTIIKWQSAVSPFTIWNDISNTTATYTSGNLTQTTQFRAVVKDGSCDEATSEVTTVTVDPLSVGGAVSGGSRICSGSPSAELTLTGHTGTIIKWQSAVSPFTIWNDISNTTATYTSGNLTQTTQFRAVVKDGSCDEATSEVTTVTVDPLSVGGAVSGGSRICSGSPSAELTLTGHTGTIIKWQSAVSPFTIWNDISNTTATYTSGNLTQTTQFRAVVKDGSCDEATSEITTVTVDLLTKPILDNLIQPSCSDANGSFNISNYNIAYSYEVIPSNGVSIVNDKVTARVGSYIVIAKLGLCNSLTSDVIVLKNYVCPIFENGTISSTGGTVFENITSNDKVNGVPVVLGATGNASVAISGIWPTGITLDPLTGKVTVDAGIAPGVYNVVYELCDKMTHQVCATVSNEIKVISVVEPIFENGTISSTGGTVFENITSNDKVNGVPVVLGATGNASVAISGIWPTGITLDPLTGKVTVDAGIAPGTYNIVYELCDKLTPKACATISNEIVVTCNSTANISGIIKNLQTNNVLANVPVTLIPQNQTTAPILLQITKSDGSYSFSGIIPGDYLVQVQDANLNSVYQLYPVNGSLRFTTIKSCGFQKFDFEYDLSVLPVLGDYVWYDLNGNGIQDEWYDANDDGIVTKNIPDANGSIDYSQWEWIDFNGDGSCRGTLNVGELNMAGFGNSKSSNILITGPNGYLKNTIIGIQGYWRDRPQSANPWGEYNVKLQMDSNLEIQSQAIGSTGLVKVIPSNTEKVISQKTNRGESSMDCAATTQSIKTITLSATNRVHLDLDFGINCSPFVSLMATNDKADFIDGILGVKGFLNVLSNDTFNGLPINPVDVILTVVPNVNFRSNSNGTLDILPNTPGGTYTLSYTICEKTNPSNCSTASVSVFVARPSIALVKTAHFNDENGNGYAQAGETITYNFVVTNTGNVALTKILVEDPLTGIIMTGNSIDLEVGEEDITSFVGVYSLSQSDINSGSISNQAIVTGTSPNGILVKDKSDYGSVFDDNPTVLPISGCSIKVFNAISLNGDKMNELFYIQGLECYPDNVVEIYNRWGVLVYEGNHYNNVNIAFKGFSEGRVTIKNSDKLPEGTYYYILKYKDSEFNTHQKTGYLYLSK